MPKFFNPPPGAGSSSFSQAQTTIDTARELSSVSGVHYLHIDGSNVSTTGSSINSATNQAPYKGLVVASQTGSNRPTLNSTGSFKSGPSIDFASASSQYFALTSYGLKMARNRPGFTLIIGHKPTSFSANQSLFWASLGTDTNSPRIHFGILATSGDRFLQYQAADGGTYNYKQWASPITAGNPVVDIIRIDAVNGDLWAYQGYNQFPIVNQFSGADSLSGTGLFSDTDSLSARFGYDNQAAGYYNGSVTFAQVFAGALSAQELGFVMRKNIQSYYPVSTRNRRQIVVTGDSNAWGLKVTTDSARMHNRIVANLTALSGGRSFDAANGGWGGIPVAEQSWLMGNGFYYDAFGMPAPNLEKKVLVINQGGNDILFGSSSSDIVANAIRVCREAKQQGVDYVAFNNIGPNTNGATNALNVAANSALATSQADTTNGLGRYCDKLVDVYTAINANTATYLDADGIHFNDAGMAVAGATIATALQSISGWSS